MHEFCEVTPSLENYWRGVILFGRNVASYKFALAKSLIELSDAQKTFITLEELTLPFSRHLIDHLKSGNKQITSKSSRVLDACMAYIDGKEKESAMHDVVAKLGFNNVIDAFHIVNQKEIPVKFFEDNRKNRSKGITLTDQIYKLKESDFAPGLMDEVEARWRLVETAWELNMSTNLLRVQHDSDKGFLYVDHDLKRVDVTSSRDALNGYQKGKCFYCYDFITTSKGSPHLGEVDHFFPHILKGRIENQNNIDGVWNLVLACRDCNGSGQKGARVPSIKLLKRLSKRNEYLIESNHPLSKTIKMQTGKSSEIRSRFLNNFMNEAKRLLLFDWEPKAKADEIF